MSPHPNMVRVYSSFACRPIATDSAEQREGEDSWAATCEWCRYHPSRRLMVHALRVVQGRKVRSWTATEMAHFRYLFFLDHGARSCLDTPLPVSRRQTSEVTQKESGDFGWIVGYVPPLVRPHDDPQMVRCGIVPD